MNTYSIEKSGQFYHVIEKNGKTGAVTDKTPNGLSSWSAADSYRQMLDQSQPNEFEFNT